MPDLWTMISQFINIPAAFAAAFIVWLIQKKLPTPEGQPDHMTVAGTISARLLPFLAPLLALAACLAVEWDKSLTAMDVIRGINTGVASEYLLRVQFKSVMGV